MRSPPGVSGGPRAAPGFFAVAGPRPRPQAAALAPDGYASAMTWAAGVDLALVLAVAALVALIARAAEREKGRASGPAA